MQKMLYLCHRSSFDNRKCLLNIQHTSRSLFAYRMAESIHQVLGGEMLQTDYQHLCDREKSGYKIFEKKCNKN